MKKGLTYPVRSVNLCVDFCLPFKYALLVPLLLYTCLPAFAGPQKKGNPGISGHSAILTADLTTNAALSVQTADIPIKGKVVDEKGETLPGVTIKVKGTQRGITTNIDGTFSLTVPEGATLVVSYIGFTTLEVVATPIMTIKLASTANDLTEVVVLGFGSTQKRSEQTAAYSTLAGKELVKAPVPDLTNALIGKIPGVVTRQGNGLPGDNAADIFIRGRSSGNSAALIVVDGVEQTSFGNIDPNEIESISVLKDASSTALYGIKAGNGVIVVTTKVGKEGAFKISYSGGAGLVSLTGLPNTVNAFDAASFTTEGENNLIAAGLYTPAQRTFQDADLIKFKDHSDPLRFPDVNWYKAVTKNNWLRTQHNLNFSGGSKFATFFVSMGYLFEDGMFKNFQQINGYRTSNSFTRYNFRSNLDFNLTKSTTFSIKFGGRVEDTYGIHGGVSATGDTGGTTAILKCYGYSFSGSSAGTGNNGYHLFFHEFYIY